MPFKIPFTNILIDLSTGFYTSHLTFPFCRVIIKTDSEISLQVLNVSISISREKCNDGEERSDGKSG